MESPMIFTCHACKNQMPEKGWWHQYDSMEKLRAHRRKHHPLDYADGHAFSMIEIKVSRNDYYMIAKTLRDTRWLKSWL